MVYNVGHFKRVCLFKRIVAERRFCGSIFVFRLIESFVDFRTGRTYVAAGSCS